VTPPLLDRATIAELMPYGPDFLWVDEVLEQDGDRRIVTSKHYLANASIVRDHTPAGVTIVPGVILIEQAAQSALLLGLRSGHVVSGKAAFLGRVKADFIAPVVCPAQVEVDLVVSVLRAEAIGFAAKLKSDLQLCAHIFGVCVLADAPAPSI